MSGQRFAPVALRLAGVAGWQLGWGADQFWSATPAEMEAVASAMLEGAAVPDAPSALDMARLQEMFPDG
jgi:hypothetical protein